jgi:hypothetical protein
MSIAVSVRVVILCISRELWFRRGACLLWIMTAVSAVPAMAQVTQLSLYGPSGSSYFRGASAVTPANGTFAAVSRVDRGIRVTFAASSSTTPVSPTSATFIFGAPFDAALVPGPYPNAVGLQARSRRPEDAGMLVQLTSPGLWRTCEDGTGEFTVLEVEYGAGNAVTKFSANFRVECGSPLNLLVGSVRFNASPRAAHQVSVTMTGSGGGAVFSEPAGLSCGSACTVSRDEGLFTILMPTPVSTAGVQWSGDADCLDGIILGGASVSCTVTYEPCRFTVTPATLDLDSEYRIDQVLTVSANGPECAWRATSDQWWLQVRDMGRAGRGWGQVPLVVREHRQSPESRRARVTVEGQTVTVTQSGPIPTYWLPATLDVGPGAGSVDLMFTSNVNEPPWTATTDVPWIRVAPAGRTTAIPVTVTRNPSRVPRVGTILVAGKAVQVVQRANGVPGEPTKLTARVQEGLASFQWQHPVEGGDATSYRFEAGFERGATVVLFLSDIPYFYRRVPDGRFFVRVRGINEFGVGVASEDYVLNVREGMNPPDPPTYVALHPTFGSSLDMSWGMPEGGGVVERYVLDVGSQPGRADLGQIPLGTDHRLVYHYPPPGYYFLSVRAVNRAGSSRASVERLYVTGASPPPPPSSLLQLTAAVRGTTVTLSWNSASGYLRRYRLTAGTTPGAADLVFDVSGTTQSLSIADVPPGRYYVRVQAVNDVGPGPASNEVYLHVR